MSSNHEIMKTLTIRILKSNTIKSFAILLLISLVTVPGCKEEEIYYTVSVTVNGPGVVTPMQGQYVVGSMVNLTAIPDVDNGFLGWTGDTRSTDNPLLLVIKSNFKINAIFEGDKDEDGVLDSQDICNDTPDGVVVMANGCPAAEIYLDENGITVKTDSWTKPGSMGELDGITYTVVDREMLDNMIANREGITRVVPTLITDMSHMYFDRSFNQDISAWDVSNVTDMTYMFSGAGSFNQDLSPWDVSNVTNCNNFSDSAHSWTLPKPNFTNCGPISLIYNHDVENIINRVDLNSLVHNLRSLSGEDSVMVNGIKTIIKNRINSNQSNDWNNDITADYLEQRLEEYGLNPAIQQYSDDGRNIFAIQEGITYPNEYYMISGHYDAMDFYCADDNASGCSTVLEAARVLSEFDFNYSIIYAFWDEEEYGLIGSDYYASQAAANGDMIQGVINMDMISWDGDDDMVVEIHSSTNANSDRLAEYILAVNNLYNFTLSAETKLPGTSSSDHASFWANGYPSALITEEYYGGDLNPYYHTDQDRIGILNMPYFHEVTKLAIATIASKALTSK